jgi:hypothetical protein
MKWEIIHTFYLIIDHWIENVCTHILISFSSLSLSLSLFASDICSWNTRNLIFFLHQYDFIFLTRRYRSNILTYDYVRYWIITCGVYKKRTILDSRVFLKRKIWLHKIDLTALSVWVIEQTIADPCWLWVRSAFSRFFFLLLFDHRRAHNRFKVMLYVKRQWKN